MPKVLPSAPAPAAADCTRGRRVSPTLAEINVVPLVDVMLVLLIIFMVAAPMLQRGVEVNLPVAQPLAGDRERADLRQRAARPSGRIAASIIGKEPSASTCSPSAMRQMMVNRTDKQVFLRGDGGVDAAGADRRDGSAEGRRRREGRHRHRSCPDEQ